MSDHEQAADKVGGNQGQPGEKSGKEPSGVSGWLTLSLLVALGVVIFLCVLQYVNNQEGSDKVPGTTDSASGNKQATAQKGKGTNGANSTDVAPAPTGRQQVIIRDEGEKEVIIVLPRVHYNYVDSDGFPHRVATIERVGASDPAFRTGYALLNEVGLRSRGSVDPSTLAGGPRASVDEILGTRIDEKIRPVQEQVDRVETKVGQLETKINEVGESTKEILKRLGGPTPAASSSTAPPGTAPAPAPGSSTPSGGTPPAGSSATPAPATPAPAVTPSAPGSSAGAAPAPPPATPSAPGATLPAPPTPAPTPAPTPDPNAGTAATSGSSTS